MLLGVTTLLSSQIFLQSEPVVKSDTPVINQSVINESSLNSDPETKYEKIRLLESETWKIVNSFPWNISTDKLTTYENATFNIAFEYPQEWGKIDEYYEMGTSCDAIRDVKNVDCHRIWLRLSDITLHSRDQGALFLTMVGKRFSEEARDGFWGDYASSLSSSELLQEHCLENTNDIYYPEYNYICSTNSHGIEIATNMKCNRVGGAEDFYCFNVLLHHPNIEGGISLASDRLNDRFVKRANEKMFALVDSIRPLNP